MFEVKIGYAFAKINLLKIHKSRKDLERRVIAAGSFATIYGITIDGKDYAIKSQSIEPKDRATLNQKIDAVLREYTLSKIASVLRFGPKMEKIFGYDILSFNDGIEFAMEMCQKNNPWSSKEEIENDLREGMKKMHSLKIVHRDVKNKNVCWSPSLEKWVFIDFGFAKFIEEPLGRKTRSKYIGTYNFVTN